jgi:hypothetical protein
MKNSHLEAYLPLNGLIFTKNGKKYKVKIEIRSVKYPFAEDIYDGFLECLNPDSIYSITCLNDPETFIEYQPTLNKLLINKYKKEGVEIKYNAESWQWEVKGRGCGWLEDCFLWIKRGCLS